MSGRLLDIRDVSVTRGGVEVLKDITLSLGEGDFVSLIGPNGAGKTTLLKVALGFFPPDRGTCERSPDLRVGYMPQDIEREGFLPLSVRRFIELNRKCAPSDLEAVYAETGIEDIVDRTLHRISGGELQRVLLARALLNRPNLLVMDEPVQNLDFSGQIAFYKRLRAIHRERKVAVLMVSHDLHMVMSSTKRVICLYGHICCDGEPHNVVNDPEFVSVFGRDLADTMSVYSHSHRHDHNGGAAGV